MPKLSDILTDSSKKKLMKIKGKITSNFVGATPNLNSSLGVNANDGTNPYSTASFGVQAGSTSDESVESGTTDPVTQSKVSTFWEKNSVWLTGLSEVLLGGGAAATTTAPPAGASFEEEDKKGMPTWAWILIAIVVLIIIVLVIKKMNK